MLASSAIRRVAQRNVRRFMTFENKNTIKETRASHYTNHSQGADLPTFWKQDGVVTFFVAAVGGFVGFSAVARGLYNMANGVNKIA